jgi:hypothetical protein
MVILPPAVTLGGVAKRFGVFSLWRNRAAIVSCVTNLMFYQHKRATVMPYYRTKTFAWGGKVMKRKRHQPQKNSAQKLTKANNSPADVRHENSARTFAPANSHAGAPSPHQNAEGVTGQPGRASDTFATPATQNWDINTVGYCPGCAEKSSNNVSLNADAPGSARDARNEGGSNSPENWDNNLRPYCPNLARPLEGMTDKEIRRMKRLDLLELLVAQGEEIEALRAQLAQAQAALDQRRIDVEAAGNIAQAALALNGVFEAAQAAADQYVYNVQLQAAGGGAAAGQGGEGASASQPAPVPTPQAPASAPAAVVGAAS